VVYYLAAIGDYSRTEWDILDASTDDVNSRIEYADPANVHWKAKKEHANKREQGYALNPDTLPKKILWGSGDRPIFDVLPWFIVSPRFRDLVEQFEPDVHQFVPVEVYTERGGAPVATYYWLIVCQRLDSVDREHTTFKWEENGDPADPDVGYWSDYIIKRDPLEMIKIEGSRLVFNASQVENNHIWCDPRVGLGGDKLCSSSFGKAAIAANFSGLSVSPRESV
jgi:hypothetical protein